jgi:MFS family permease
MQDKQPSRTRSQLLRRGEFAKLWWAGTISSFGDWVSLFATLALGDLIGGGLGTLVPLVGRFVPAILFGPIGGVLADRVNRKTIMLVADVGRGFLVLSLILVRTLPQLFAVSFAIEILSLLRQPVRESVVPELVQQGELITANSLSVVGSYGIFPLGAIGWSALSKFPQWVGWDVESPFTAGFTLDFLTFMISAAIVAITSIPIRSPVAGRENWNWKAPFGDLAEGVRFVVGHRGVRVVIIGMSFALFGSGAIITLGQTFARSFIFGDDSGFALLATAMGGGGAIGIILVNRIDRAAVHRMVVFSAAITLTGTALAALAFSTTVVMAATFSFMFGLSAGIGYVVGITYLQMGSAEAVRGRTFAALFLVGRSALLVSMTVAAFAAKFLHGRFADPLDDGVRLIFVLGGAITVFAGVVTLWVVREVWVPRLGRDSV